MPFVETRILQYKSKHQPWCRIFHNPAMTTECWCDSQIAGTAYKLGLAEGMGLLAVKIAHLSDNTVDVTEVRPTSSQYGRLNPDGTWDIQEVLPDAIR